MATRMSWESVKQRLRQHNRTEVVFFESKLKEKKFRLSKKRNWRKREWKLVVDGEVLETDEGVLLKVRMRPSGADIFMVVLFCVIVLAGIVEGIRSHHVEGLVISIGLLSIMLFKGIDGIEKQNQEMKNELQHILNN